MKNVNNVFKKIKRLIESKNDYKKEIDGYFYNEKAIEYVNSLTKEQYFINGYYDLTTSDILNMINYSNVLGHVKFTLYEEYTRYYAEAIYNNFLEILKRGIQN